ncbi:SET and MYND domain-containing protein 4 [Mortierella polycephala]|uniref:SET and MYND domain-containing protein 4 n=1 Tax=Mortierella polycephala TaxID=41804 RepID=A0A9P6U394_9FUNG|nr:SET and MYND domain-containing protein 4 [Mortierella polycephala]
MLMTLPESDLTSVKEAFISITNKPLLSKRIPPPGLEPLPTLSSVSASLSTIAADMSFGNKSMERVKLDPRFKIGFSKSYGHAVELDQENAAGFGKVGKLESGTFVFEKDEMPYACIIEKAWQKKLCEECLRRLPEDKSKVVVCLGCTNATPSTSSTSLLEASQFCSQECLKEAWRSWHGYECGFMDDLKELNQKTRLALRVYWKNCGRQSMTESSSSSGSNVDVLAAGVSRLSLDSNAPRIKNKNGSDIQPSQLYHDYMQLEPTKRMPLLMTGYYIQRLLDLPEDAAVELAHLQAMVQVNSFAVKTRFLEARDGETTVDKMDDHAVGNALYLLASMFNHSCAPNAMVVFGADGRTPKNAADRKTNVREPDPRAINVLTTSTLKLDKDLPVLVEISYGPQAGRMSTEERKECLKLLHFFECNCSACNDRYAETITKKIYKCPKNGYTCRPMAEQDRICPTCKTEIDMMFRRKMHQLISRLLTESQNPSLPLTKQLTLLKTLEDTQSKIFVNTCMLYGNTCDQLAMVYAESGDLTQSIEWCKRALKVVVVHFPHDSIEVAQETLKLAGLLFNNSQPREAMKQVRIAITLYKGHYGVNSKHPDLLELYQMEKVLKQIKIPFRGSSAGKTLVRVFVIIKFSKEALENLERYKLKSTSNTRKLQSIEITVDVIESNDKVQSTKGTVSISEVLGKPKLDADKPLVLQLPSQIILTEGDRELGMHLNTELQLRQAGGFTIERVDIVNGHENLVNVVNLFHMKACPVLVDKSTSEQPPRTTTQFTNAKHPTGAFMIDNPIRGPPAPNGLGNRSGEVQPLNLTETCLTVHPTAPDFPRKWYLFIRNDAVITAQTECAPFLVSKTTSVELNCKATQSSVVSITVNLRFTQSLLQQLEKYAETYRSAKKENKEHGLKYLQSIKVEAQVTGQARKIIDTLCLTDHRTYGTSKPTEGNLVAVRFVTRRLSATGLVNVKSTTVEHVAGKPLSASLSGGKLAKSELAKADVTTVAKANVATDAKASAATDAKANAATDAKANTATGAKANTATGAKAKTISNFQDPGPRGGAVCIDVCAGSNCLAFRVTEDMTMRRDMKIEIALSYDGSQVVLVPTGVGPLPAPSCQSFKCDLENKAIKCTETPSELVSFVGYGDFHTTLRDGKDPDTQHELFLACDGLSVFVFSSPTDGTWVKLREIHLVKPPASIDSLSISDLFNHVVNKVFRRNSVHTMSPTRPNPDLVAAEKLIRNIRNRHFAWTGRSKVVSVWDLVSGRMVSHVRFDSGNEGQIRNVHAHMSADGIVLAVWHEEKKCVETYWAATGIQTRRCLSSKLIGDQFVAPDSTLKPSKPPMNVFDWTKAPLAVQLCSYESWRIDTSAGGEQVFTCLTKSPSPAIKVQGLQTVFAQLGNRPNQTTGAIKSLRIDSETAQNGCLDDLHGDYRFTFDYARRVNKAVCSIQWKGTNDPANPLIKFIATFQYANVYFQDEKLVLEADSFILEWKLPQKKEDTCRLLLCWSREQGKIGSTEPAQQNENTWGLKGHQRHQRHQGNDLYHAEIRSDMELNREYAARFMGGIPILLKMLEDARQSDQDDYFRGSIGFAIVGYLGAFINHNPTPDSPQNSVMAGLCSGLTQANKFQLKNLMHQILREKKGWSPIPQYPTYRNKDEMDMPSCPFGILYMLDNGGADAKALVKKLYRHCMDQAESTGNIHYLAPVFESLTDFLKLLPRDASDTLRRISTIKGTDLEFIATSHFDGCRYNFQSTIKRDGDEDEKQRAYYVVPTGVLWRHRSKQESVYEESVTIDSPWYWILLRLIAYKLNPLCHNYVQCHDYVQHCDFETNILDNPGIEAVIGQRWNIAQFYWLSGFAVQCLLFFLIFLTILAKDTDFLFISGWDCGFFIFIFIISGILLWSEVSWIWKHHSKGIRYDNSGLFIFAVPLASCVLELRQMRNGTFMLGLSLSFGSYLLGISLVLISLQLLFELRVYQRVCKFYLILLNFMSKFMTSFIVSFLVVLTAMVTASHLLYTFIGDMQANGIHIISSSHSGAPSMDMSMNTPFYFVHIFVAISVLMPFIIYTMLPFILYFATGLLEEIHAVTENDVMHMWNENRLPYVIGAENLTYVVPGLRDKLGYPNQIYYRMTKTDELEYSKRQRERVD